MVRKGLYPEEWARGVSRGSKRELSIKMQILLLAAEGQTLPEIRYTLEIPVGRMPTVNALLLKLGQRKGRR
jgi:hypothetical protein